MGSLSKFRVNLYRRTPQIGALQVNRTIHDCLSALAAHLWVYISVSVSKESTSRHGGDLTHWAHGHDVHGVCVPRIDSACFASMARI